MKPRPDQACRVLEPNRVSLTKEGSAALRDELAALKALIRRLER
jgi:hypothetical protein